MVTDYVVGPDAGEPTRELAADTASPDFLRMTLELGATRCLRKPFTPAALLAAVNDCLNKPKVNAHRQEN